MIGYSVTIMLAAVVLACVLLILFDRIERQAKEEEYDEE